MRSLNGLHGTQCRFSSIEDVLVLENIRQQMLAFMKKRLGLVLNKGCLMVIHVENMFPSDYY